jgi:hypothetical protein
MSNLKTLKSYFDKIFYAKAIVFILFSIVILLATQTFISKENYIYYWDFSGYWNIYKSTGDLPVIEFVLRTIRTIRSEDYNMLPIFFLLPFFKIFGESRITYVMGIVFVYALPSILLFVILCKRLWPNPEAKRFSFYILSLAAIIILPSFWFPILYGMPDVIGLVVIFAILIIYQSGNLKDFSYKKIALLALLLGVLIFTRRWYSFWLVGFFVAAGLENIIGLFKNYRFEFKKYIPFVWKYGVMSILAGGFILVVGLPLIKRIILTDYTNIYASYKSTDSILGDLNLFITYHGIIVLGIALSGLYWLVKNPNTRRFAFFLVVQGLVTYLLFIRVQDLDRHHQYLLIPTIAILVYSGLSGFIMNVHDRLMKKIGGATLLLLLGLNFIIGFSFIPNQEVFPKLFSGYQHQPLVRNDIAEVDRLLIDVFGYIDNDIATNPSVQPTIYVVSSSSTLNDDILRNRCKDIINNTSFNCDKVILESSHIDKRDLEPVDVFGAKYVIVGNPIGYHLNPRGQKVVGNLAKQFLENEEGISQKFTKLDIEYCLEKNTKVYIYQRK